MKAIEIARLKKENEELKGRIKNLEWDKDQLLSLIEGDLSYVRGKDGKYIIDLFVNRELEEARKIINNVASVFCYNEATTRSTVFRVSWAKQFSTETFEDIVQFLVRGLLKEYMSQTETTEPERGFLPWLKRRR